MTTESRAQYDVRAAFARGFRAWRLAHQIPLKQIASDLRVSISTISAWELGQRFPSGRHFEQLVNYTGLPPCRLFCVMSDRCVPAGCVVAMSQNASV
jgi:transcriptional regulator with XRE-family HTH domain